jgi:ribosomal protein S18 acetylase RimI-like enzyme
MMTKSNLIGKKKQKGAYIDPRNDTAVAESVQTYYERDGAAEHAEKSKRSLKGGVGLMDSGLDASAEEGYRMGQKIRVFSDRGSPVDVEILTPEQIGEMKQLDDECFGSHQGISEEALQKIQDNGLLVCVRDPATGKMIAEGQLITRAIPDADEHIVRNLGENDAYFEGFAVHPDYRNGDYASAISRAMQTAALAEGKTTMYATVRPENAASVKRLTREGFAFVAYEPYYYEGDAGKGARLILATDLTGQDGLCQAATTIQGASDRGEKIYTDQIDVSFGDDVDVFTHSELWQKLGPSRDNTLVGAGIANNKLVFTRLEKPFTGYDQYERHAPKQPQI